MTPPPRQTGRARQGKVALLRYSPAGCRQCGATTRDTSDLPDPTVDRLRARESSDLCSWRTRLGSIPFFITGGVPQGQMQLLAKSKIRAGDQERQWDGDTLPSSWSREGCWDKVFLWCR